MRNKIAASEIVSSNLLHICNWITQLRQLMVADLTSKDTLSTEQVESILTVARELCFFDSESLRSGFSAWLTQEDVPPEEEQIRIQIVCWFPGLTGEGNTGLPPIVWVDDHRVLFMRTHIPEENVVDNTRLIMYEKLEDWLTVADVATGTLTDIVKIDGQGRFVDFLCPVSATQIPVIIDSGTSNAGRYAIDLEAKTLNLADTPVGEFQFRGGGYSSSVGLQFVDSFLHKEREIAEPKRGMYVCVSPDGKRIIWRADAGDNSRAEYHVRYYDSEEGIIRTVSEGWSTEPFLWFKSRPEQ